MTQQRSQQRAKSLKGFTLIELLLVIVLLGILFTVAFIKLFSFSNDAIIAKLEAQAGAMRSSYRLIYAKAKIEGIAVGTNTLDVGGATIALNSGYPTAHWNNSVRYMLQLDSVGFSSSNAICQRDWCGKGNQRRLPSGLRVRLPARIAKAFPQGYSFNDQCGVYYINRTDGSEPIVGIETADC